MFSGQYSQRLFDCKTGHFKRNIVSRNIILGYRYSTMEDLKGLLCFVDLSRKQKVLYSCCLPGKILSLRRVKIVLTIEYSSSRPQVSIVYRLKARDL